LFEKVGIAASRGQIHTAQLQARDNVVRVVFQQGFELCSPARKILLRDVSQREKIARIPIARIPSNGVQQLDGRLRKLLLFVILLAALEIGLSGKRRRLPNGISQNAPQKDRSCENHREK